MIPFVRSPKARALSVTISVWLVVTAAALAAFPARAEVVAADDDNFIYVWPRWQKGAELGVRAFGRFGSGTNINTPQGDLLVQAQYHLWYRHLVGLHVNLGMGIMNGTFMYGAGTRLNVLEFIEDPTREMLVRGLQRGVLGSVLKNFMLFLSLDYLHLGFKDPEPGSGLDYEASVWKLVPGAGAQWYFYFPQKFAGRFYLETAIGYTTLGGSNFFTPVFSLGAELL